MSDTPILDVVAVTPLDNWRLYITFEDGCSGTIDVQQLTRFSGVFQPLLDPDYFQTVKLDPDLGTVCWNSGADLDPLVLYSIISAQTTQPSPHSA